jgi:hypothetical protein
VEETILAKSKDGKIPCAVCFKIADDLGVPKKEITKVLNEMKIKISQCQLGCFEWLSAIRVRVTLVAPK